MNRPRKGPEPGAERETLRPGLAGTEGPQTLLSGIRWRGRLWGPAPEGIVAALAREILTLNAGVVGLAPSPRDSGKISGNHHRPRRYDRRLLRVFYLSGPSALKNCPASRRYYDRKRAEGKTHIQAMLSLARRRLNVLWAMLRDGTTYNPASAATPTMATLGRRDFRASRV